MPEDDIPDAVKQQIQEAMRRAAPEQTAPPAPPPAGLGEEGRQKALDIGAAMGATIAAYHATPDAAAPHDRSDDEASRRTAEKIASADRVGYDQEQTIEKMTRDDILRY